MDRYYTMDHGPVQYSTGSSKYIFLWMKSILKMDFYWIEWTGRIFHGLELFVIRDCDYTRMDCQGDISKRVG